jgi:hypothetical protein
MRKEGRVYESERTCLAGIADDPVQ